MKEQSSESTSIFRKPETEHPIVQQKASAVALPIRRHHTIHNARASVTEYIYREMPASWHLPRQRHTQTLLTEGARQPSQEAFRRLAVHVLAYWMDDLLALQQVWCL